MRIFENIDCMEGMEKYKDILQSRKTLAIVDPPYRDANSPTKDMRRNGSMDNIIGRPSTEYWILLDSVCINSIKFGANNFQLPQWKGFVVWKKKTISEDFTMSMCEIAAISEGLGTVSKWIELAPQGNVFDPRIHPTQKPIALYKWLLENYSKDHDLILDTHVGSASSLIACEEFGIDYIGFELDKDYYNSAKERLEKARFIRENKKADECFVNDLALFNKENI